MFETQTMSMPTVFVVPPEEDDSPAWCFFDAANPTFGQLIQMSESSDLTEDDEATSIDAIIIAQRSQGLTSVVDALADRDFAGDDSESECENEPLPEGAQPRTLRDAANDSDVIEVVKVRRKKAGAEEEELGIYDQQASQPSRPTTLKSRASRAFKSFKGTLRSKSKSRAQDNVSASSSRSSSQNDREVTEQPPQESIPRARTPTASRRGSRIFSQLFNPPPLKPRSSIPSFDEPTPASPTQPSLRSYDSSATNSRLSRRSSMYDDASAMDQARLQAASPAPTTASRKSSRRFSKLNLQKLFSFGSQSTSQSSADDTPTPFSPEEPELPATPTIRSVASTPAFSSSSSNSGPETPTSTEHQIPMVRLVTPSSKSEDNVNVDTPPADNPVFDALDSIFDPNSGLNLGLGLGLNLESSDSNPPRDSIQTTPRRSSSSSVWGALTPKRLSSKSTPPPPALEEDDDGDTSLEMRLDSLHFESISFDADRF